MVKEKPVAAGIKPGGVPYQVLIIDDSSFIAKQLSKILTSEGFVVSCPILQNSECSESVEHNIHLNIKKAAQELLLGQPHYGFIRYDSRVLLLLELIASPFFLVCSEGMPVLCAAFSRVIRLLRQGMAHI